jgi:hypothetical protein
MSRICSDVPHHVLGCWTLWPNDAGFFSQRFSSAFATKPICSEPAKQNVVVWCQPWFYPGLVVHSFFWASVRLKYCFTSPVCALIRTRDSLASRATCTLQFVMPKSRKIVFGFALLGLAVAGVCYAFAALHDYSKPWTGLDSSLTLLSVIVCPPQLIFAFCIDCEVVGWNGFVQYAIIGLLNTALYVAVGAVVASLRKKSA